MPIEPVFPAAPGGLPDAAAAWRPRPGPGPAGALPPTPATPLAGLTLLLVEDSRFASDALRLLAQRAGARLKRAETLRAAAAHLRLYRPDVVIVDLGLPDGDGTALIGQLSGMAGAPPVLGFSGAGFAPAALQAGAAGFLEKPIRRQADFTEAVLALLPDRAWLRGRGEGAGAAQPDALALRDDFAAAARRLDEGAGAAERRYLGRFVAGLARMAGDAGLAQLGEAMAEGEGSAPPRLAAALAERLARPWRQAFRDGAV
jgi:CheY-like chemotaxis protein